MIIKTEGIELNLPTLIPMSECFEDAMSWVKKPVEALAQALTTVQNVDHLNPSELLNAARGTLELFLEQLNYIIDNSYIGDKAICFAEVRHPFKIKSLFSEQQLNAEGG